MKSALRKNMGKKNCEFTTEIRKEIMRIFMEMEESEISRVFNNSEFGYWSITVERPLRLRVDISKQIPVSALNDPERELYEAAIAALPKNTPFNDWAAFAKVTKLKTALLKKVRPYITEKDPTAKPVEGEADVELRDTEVVPFTYDGGVTAFLENEVRPYAADAYMDEKQTKIGYEISFTKYFYKPMELRSMAEIISDLKVLEAETDGMMAEILRGLER